MCIRDRHSPVLFHPDGAAGAGGAALIAAARSRTVPVDQALTEIAALHAALTAAGCPRIAYKACASFDSTAKGNIGPAADFLADKAGQRPVPVSYTHLDVYKRQRWPRCP